MKKNYLKKLVSVAIASSLLTFGLVGCGESDKKESGNDTTAAAIVQEGDTNANTEGDEKLKVVKIATPGVDTDGSAAMVENAFYAQKKGIFEEELNKIGYTAEYVGFATAGVGINEALASGDVDIAFYGDFPALTYISSGNDARIFATNNGRVQLGIFAGESISTVADLKGKKIGLTIGTNAYKFLIDSLEKNGLQLEDVEVVNGSSELGSLYFSGDIDAIVSSTLLFYSLTAQGAPGHMVYVNQGDSDTAARYIGLIRESYANDNPKVEQAIVDALKRSAEEIKTNPDEFYNLLGDASEYFDAEVYRDYYNFENALDYLNPVITDEIINEIQDTEVFMYENGYLPTEVNVKDFVDIVQ